jgi:hypothetical protein
LIRRNNCKFELCLQQQKIKKPVLKKFLGVIDPNVGNYEKHPFFVKKANEAKAILKALGLPKKPAKAK